jgi:hypothetical protein
MGKYGFRDGLGRVASTHPVQHCLPAIGIVVGEGSKESMTLPLLGPQPLDLGPKVVFGPPFLILVSAVFSSRSTPSAGYLAVTLEKSWVSVLAVVAPGSKFWVPGS